MNGLQKFYIGLWITFGLTVVGLGISGNLTMLALTVLGTICFGIIFMGMMCVLPGTVAHAVPVSDRAVRVAGPRTTLRRFVNAWSHPVGVEVNRPRLH
jgi:hypothetical protein